MLSRVGHIDRFFLLSIGALTLVGFVIFLSASLGLLTQDGVSFVTVATKQIISLVIGITAFFFFSRLKYTYLRKTALFIFLGAIAINLLLFIPSLSLFHGGAARWINIGPLSFQPSEFLKIAFIIYLAAWIQFAKDKISTLKFGLAPYLVITAILGGLLLAQSDTDTFLIIAFTGVVMLLIAGMPIKHMAMAGGVLALVVVSVVLLRPYAYQRVQTFFTGGSDTRGAGYQINQSLIAIGSGEITGRGFGQSIQKFGYLPQPTDDSIFAVASEEFGFIGSTLLVGLYLLIIASAFRIAGKAPDLFGSMIAVGIGVLIITESFLNMSAMLGIVPLSGVPLLFVSHGGTALIIILAAAGVLANVSRYAKG
ncbi:MAG: putative peptidoglycan glycosyltransferase FtsW [Candidatus Pacebacteria bacterium]|nr:putative peptidoglycan glycosyltransferase FtsW [Candidatus Paceibacterota bacterium]